MMTVNMRPYAGETDLQAIAHLINTCEAVDRLEEGTSVEELRAEFDSPLLDKGRDICLWEDDSGKLIGFAKLSIPESGEAIEGWLWFRVHPDARGGDLERQIFAWAEKRMGEVGSDRNVRVKLRLWQRADRSDAIALLESAGFTGDRYFCRMQRSLAEPIPEPQFPEGFALRPGGHQDAEAWVQMFNQTFIDHWNFRDVTVEEIKHQQTNPDYQPELDLTAVAPDGTYAAFCYCSVNPEQNARTGRAEGWIAILGTRRNFRKMGLGRSMLLSGLHCLKAAGMDAALLIVDVANGNGALPLYESVGFCKVHTVIAHVKEL